MGQCIDLSQRLTNQQATIKIDSAHEFVVNKSKNAAIAIMQLRKDDKTNEFDFIDKVMEIALGKEALDYINSLNYLTIDQHSLIVEAIMAIINEQPLEEVEKEADKAKKEALKRFQE